MKKYYLLFYLFMMVSANGYVKNESTLLQHLELSIHFGAGFSRTQDIVSETPKTCQGLSDRFLVFFFCSVFQ